MPEPRPRIEAIWTYPVKSLGGGPHGAAAVERWGLAGDRRWMAVTPDGMFMTQRQFPRMALIRAEATLDGLALSSAAAGRIAIPAPPDDARIIDVTVWRDSLPARLAGAASSSWLSRALSVECRLVYMADPSSRPVNQRHGAPGDTVSFADSFPLLLGNDASLADLNERLAQPVPMTRFRPNLVVSGAPPWAEDGWRRIRVGAVRFRIVKPCERCIITTIDPATGERPDRTEPLRTLARFRKDASGGVMFGQNMIPEETGLVRLGDTVEVLESGPPNVTLTPVAKAAADGIEA